MTDYLSNLKPPEGAKTEKRRVGRGHGSTFGKTSGRGHKGQKARSGGNIPPHFEGGQMPLYRRLPKWGFNRDPNHETEIINVHKLASAFEDGQQVTVEVLEQRDLVSKPYDRVKVLGDGEIDKALDVKVDAFSDSARDKIEEAGGTTEVI